MHIKDFINNSFKKDYSDELIFSDGKSADNMTVKKFFDLKKSRSENFGASKMPTFIVIDRVNEIVDELSNI